MSGGNNSIFEALGGGWGVTKIVTEEMDSVTWIQIQNETDCIYFHLLMGKAWIHIFINYCRDLRQPVHKPFFYCTRQNNVRD